MFTRLRELAGIGNNARKAFHELYESQLTDEQRDLLNIVFSETVELHIEVSKLIAAMGPLLPRNLPENVVIGKTTYMEGSSILLIFSALRTSYEAQINDEREEEPESND